MGGADLGRGRLDVRIHECAIEELRRYRVRRDERLEFAYILQALHAAGELRGPAARDFGIREKAFGPTRFFMQAIANRPADAPVVWIFFCLGDCAGRPTAIVLGCAGMCVMRWRSCRDATYAAMALRASRTAIFFD